MTYGATGLATKLPVSYPGLTLWIILAKLRSVPGPKTLGSAQLVATGHLLHAREPMMAFGVCWLMQLVATQPQLVPGPGHVRA